MLSGQAPHSLLSALMSETSKLSTLSVSDSVSEALASETSAASPEPDSERNKARNVSRKSFDSPGSDTSLDLILPDRNSAPVFPTSLRIKKFDSYNYFLTIVISIYTAGKRNIYTDFRELYG